MIVDGIQFRQCQMCRHPFAKPDLHELWFRSPSGTIRRCYVCAGCFGDSEDDRGYAYRYCIQDLREIQALEKAQ